MVQRCGHEEYAAFEEPRAVQMPRPQEEGEITSIDGEAGRGWGTQALVGVHKEERAPSHRLSTPP